MSTDESLQQIAHVLREERRRRGLTQAQLAELLGLTRAYVSELESGRGTTQLRRLATALRSVGVDLVAVPRR